MASTSGEERFERDPTFAFGRIFTHIPDHVRDDLCTLEREGAVYTDHWIDTIGDFRHVRIDLTPEERIDFARRMWAYELFLRSDCYWASDVPKIDADVARGADAYAPTLRDGTKITPPWHCVAAFLGEHLEGLVCGRSDRETIIDLQGREALIFEVTRAISSLTATIRSFNRRDKGLAPWSITCEKDVRDLLYVMLRPRVFDIQKEEPVPSRVGLSKIVDLCSNHAQFMLELKWIALCSVKCNTA